MIWLADGMFPSSRSLEEPAGLEEERRLFYVGITRCMDELYVTYPEMRLGAGYGEVFQRPSRFLTEVPEVLLSNGTSPRPPHRRTIHSDRPSASDYLATIFTSFPGTTITFTMARPAVASRTFALARAACSISSLVACFETVRRSRTFPFT